jgi:hypothetical protein
MRLWRAECEKNREGRKAHARGRLEEVGALAVTPGICSQDL